MSIYIGIDWSQDKHDVAFMNAAGAIIVFDNQKRRQKIIKNSVTPINTKKR